MKAFEKMQDREEKKRRKDEAAALGPKPRGRPPKVIPSEVDVDKSSTTAEKGSPPVKAPLKRRKVKTAGGGAEGAEPSAGSAKRASQPVAKASAKGKAKAEGKVGKGEKAEKVEKAEMVPQADDGAVGKGDAKVGKGEKVGKLEKAEMVDPQVPKWPNAAQAKRDAKVKLGLCKLADNLSDKDAHEMQLPGLGFEGKCWTAVPSGDAMGGGSRIRVIPYQETFYVAGSAHLPDYLTSVLKVAWHLVVGLNCKC